MYSCDSVLLIFRCKHSGKSCGPWSQELDVLMAQRITELGVLWFQALTVPSLSVANCSLQCCLPALRSFRWFPRFLNLSASRPRPLVICLLPSANGTARMPGWRNVWRCLRRGAALIFTDCIDADVLIRIIRRPHTHRHNSSPPPPSRCHSNASRRSGS